MKPIFFGNLHVFNCKVWNAIEVCICIHLLVVPYICSPSLILKKFHQLTVYTLLIPWSQINLATRSIIMEKHPSRILVMAVKVQVCVLLKQQQSQRENYPTIYARNYGNWMNNINLIHLSFLTRFH